MLLDSLLGQIKDLLAAPRWDYPDTPGSAHVPDLNCRLTPKDFRSLRSTPEGEFLLDLLESFEAALNDDWLPFDLAGLPLPQAKDLLGQIAASMRERRQLVSLEQARAIHRALVEQVA